MRGSILGNNVKRVEDPRFIRGEGRYTDDLDVTEVLHLRPVRSLLPHGNINEVHVSDARTAPGVVAVYTGADLDLRPNYPAGRIDLAASRHLLAKDKVRFTGEAIAVVLAETGQAGADAADLIWADIDPLPAVAGLEAAAAEGAPLLFEELGTNVVKESTFDRDPELFVDADVVVHGRFWNQRVAPMPMEGNTVLAIPEEDGRITLWIGTQNVFGHRRQVAKALQVEFDLVHGRVPDMGGGFGAKFYTYPEHVLTAELARRHGRPVKWIESRSENLLAMTHGRAQLQEVEIGAMEDGTLVALRVHIDQDIGAYPTFGVEIPYWTGVMASGPYRIPRIEFSYRGIVTNTMSIHAYRGAGRPEATAFLERIMDMLAARLRIEPAELRKRNFFQPADFPIVTVVDTEYDTGDYERTLDLALATAGYEELRKEQQRRREAEERVQLGIGISSYVEVTAGETGPEEWGAAEVNEDGTVTIGVGVSPHGQGHETAFAQIAAGIFKLPYTSVETVFGDTDRVARGTGTGGSRSLQLGGSAVLNASEKVVEKARKIVAHLNEASIDDVVVFDDGAVGVAGVPDTALSWGDLATISRDSAALPDGMDPGLAEQTDFAQGKSTFSFGTHVSVVELDTDTGDVTIRRHIAIDDAGEILNRWLLDGQVHGGIAQGVGQARFEEMRYDADGNPLTANLVSYLLPMAGDLPSFEVDHTVTPTPLNPLGVKGIGEAATIGSTPAIQNAVVDALSPFGIDHLDMPATPNRVWEAIRRASTRGPAAE